MDEKAINIVKEYTLSRIIKLSSALGRAGKFPTFDVYIVWKCKTLQNWKYLIATTLSDDMYYELTYDGDNGRWYLDAYKKLENKVIED